MYGWVHNCLQQFIISRYSLELWEEIKERAGCYQGNLWIRYEWYPDELSMALLISAANLTHHTFDELLELYGQHFMIYVTQEGYLNLLTLAGDDLREWLSNVNELHVHLKHSLPLSTFPELYCVDDESARPGEEDRSMVLHYYSHRGGTLANMVVGMVKEVARFVFKLEIEMIRIATQDQEDSPYTTWRVVIVKELCPIETSSSSSSSTTTTVQTREREKGGGGNRLLSPKEFCESFTTTGGSDSGSSSRYCPFSAERK